MYDSVRIYTDKAREKSQSKGSIIMSSCPFLLSSINSVHKGPKP